MLTIRKSLSLLIGVTLLAGCHDEPARDIGVVHQEKAASLRITCEDGFRPLKAEPGCEPEVIQYGPEQRFEGSVSIAMERFAFYPSSNIEGVENVQSFWLSFADKSLEECLFTSPNPDLRPVKVQSLFWADLPKVVGEAGALVTSLPMRAKFK